MENKINKKVETYVEGFRSSLREKIIALDIDKDTQTKLLETLYSMETLQLNKEDFMKRKRIVSSIPITDRCIAKKANGEQCTRKKKDECSFCGTHDKYQPHGVVSLTPKNKMQKKVCLTIVDINGINYYVDDSNNVYDTSHILKNISNPTIIGKLEKNGDKLEMKSN